MPLVHYDTTGQTLYARFDDGSNTAVNLTEGTTLNLGRYTAADAAIVSAGLGAGTYTGRIFVGTAGAQASSDYQIGSFGGFVWSGSVETVDQPQTGDAFARLGAPAGASVSADLATIAADTNEVQGDWADGGRLDLLLDAKATSAQVAAIAVAAVSPDRVSKQRTWIGREYRAANIVEVGDNFAGVLSLIPDVNPNASILTVDSVSITGAAVVVATDLTTTADRMRANFTVPALTTVGTYTVVVTVTTTDGDVIPTTATLIVR